MQKLQRQAGGYVTLTKSETLRSYVLESYDPVHIGAETSHSFPSVP